MVTNIQNMYERFSINGQGKFVATTNLYLNMFVPGNLSEQRQGRAKSPLWLPLL